MKAAMSESIFRKDGTAQGVAKQRLIETIAKPDERVINDPYADRFVDNFQCASGSYCSSYTAYGWNFCTTLAFLCRS